MFLFSCISISTFYLFRLSTFPRCKTISARETSKKFYSHRFETQDFNFIAVSLLTEFLIILLFFFYFTWLFLFCRVDQNLINIFCVPCSASNISFLKIANTTSSRKKKKLKSKWCVHPKKLNFGTLLRPRKIYVLSQPNPATDWTIGEL